MNVTTENFAHGGAHLSNDDYQAHMTVISLAVFAMFAALLVLFAVRAA